MKFEYKVVDAWEARKKIKNPPDSWLEPVLNSYGGDRWELIGYFGGILIFKRETPSFGETF